MLYIYNNLIIYLFQAYNDEHGLEIAQFEIWHK